MQKKTNGRTILHAAIYPTTGYKLYPKNCSASGKKKGGGHHVVKAFCLSGFTTLSRSLFFQIFISITVVNLLNCKHRMRFVQVRLEVVAIGSSNVAAFVRA